MRLPGPGTNSLRCTKVRTALGSPPHSPSSLAGTLLIAQRRAGYLARRSSTGSLSRPVPYISAHLVVDYRAGDLERRYPKLPSRKTSSSTTALCRASGATRAHLRPSFSDCAPSARHDRGRDVVGTLATWQQFTRKWQKKTLPFNFASPASPRR